MNELLEQLTRPFQPDAITWKPGSTTKDGAKCMAMAYADFREYMKRLDEVCGMDWSCRYVSWGDDRIMCELTITGVTRASTGEMGTQDEKNEIGGTVAEAQAFKRACAMFGLGRYLYDLPSAWVAYDASAKKISKEGQNDLDNRYRTYYQKAMAEIAKRQANKPRQVEPSTGEILGAPGQTTDNYNVVGDEVFAKDEPLMSEAQQKKVNAIGHDLYGEEWDTWRHKHAENVSQGRTMSSSGLTRQEASTLIDKLELLVTFEDLGQELYLDQWGPVSRRNANRISAGAITEPDMLIAEQLQKLIDGMMTLKAKRGEQPHAETTRQAA